MSERKKAPWPDFAGHDIYEGDTIAHPSGETGIVVIVDSFEWKVNYRDGDAISRLCLQIGVKGRAVVVKRAEEKNVSQINLKKEKREQLLRQVFYNNSEWSFPKGEDSDRVMTEEQFKEVTGKLLDSFIEFAELPIEWRRKVSLDAGHALDIIGIKAKDFIMLWGGKQ
jgi:hypothetical protein